MKKAAKKTNNVSRSAFHVSRYSGFTLLEVIISIFIFSVIIVAAIAVFVKVISVRKTTRTVQSDLESTRTALDVMAKNMRMSLDLAGGGSEIHMFNASQGACVEYRFQNNELQIQQSRSNIPETTNCGSAGAYVGGQSYTAIIENVTNGKFLVIPTSVAGKTIGRATVSMDVDGKHVQTTVSFRDYAGIIQF